MRRVHQTRARSSQAANQPLPSPRRVLRPQPCRLPSSKRSKGVQAELHLDSFWNSSATWESFPVDWEAPFWKDFAGPIKWLKNKPRNFAISPQAAANLCVLLDTEAESLAESLKTTRIEVINFVWALPGGSRWIQQIRQERVLGLVAELGDSGDAQNLAFASRSFRHAA
jgi:hypothetical protein